jgi:hypothetical protein
MIPEQDLEFMIHVAQSQRVTRAEYDRYTSLMLKYARELLNGYCKQQLELPFK